MSESREKQADKTAEVQINVFEKHFLMVRQNISFTEIKNREKLPSFSSEKLELISVCHLNLIHNFTDCSGRGLFFAHDVTICTFFSQ